MTTLLKLYSNYFYAKIVMVSDSLSLHVVTGAFESVFINVKGSVISQSGAVV